MLFVTALTALSTAAAAPVAAQNAKPNIPAELRNVRYCEILTMTRHGLTFDIDVYNTLGLNFCPADKWQAIDATKLAKELNVSRVNLNGPRYWTLDAIKASGATAQGETRTFDGLAMTHRATLNLKLWQAKAGGYRVNTIRRNTSYLFKAGQPVFELVSPKGDVYMMQSYAQIVDPKLSYDDLPKLGSRLKMPKGWTYRTRTLDADYTLTANGTAYLVQDDLFNSYQRRPK